MKSSMRQWRRLVLLGMLAWVVIFLALFSYFLDARANKSPTSAGSPLSQHPDTRRLASIQASHQQNAAPTSGSAPTSPEPGRRDDADPQTLAAWSSFGTENVGSHSDPLVQSREAASQTAGYPKPGGGGGGGGGEEDEEDERDEGEGEDAEEVKTNRIRSQQSEPEEKPPPKSASLLKRMWQGRLSADMLDPRLQRARIEYMKANKHHVAYKGPRRASQSAKQLLCQMKAQARLSTLDGSEKPFSSLGWARLVPPSPLERLRGSRAGAGAGFGTCAVVASAGAILRSGLGKEIDAHDAVLRFNAAPTEGYQKDVGNKTTIRIINSMVMASPKHHFQTSSLYKNVTLVAWDPAPYTLNLHKWYASPDYDLFSPYAEHRKFHPDQPFYILHPRYIWGLWDLIQGNTQVNIQPNPPSSGFTGILLMMALCEQVHVYEYIPSMRKSELCHYYERYFDMACTLGAYHPLLYEKSLIQRINTGTEADLRRKGRLTLPGFRTLDCDVST